MVRINWDSIDEPSSNIMPDGDYLAKVVDAEERTASTGTEMIALKLEVTKGAYAGKWVWDNLVFSAKAMPRLKIVGKAMGLNMKGEADITPNMFLGKVCVITTAQESYNGKTRAKITFDGYAPASDYAESGHKSATELYDDDKNPDKIPF